MQSFELNKHGKIVFPANCFPDLDFSTFDSIEQLDAVIRRDFDSKAPTGTDILERIKTGAYHAEFGSHPDEAAHYVTGLMVRDYLASGLPGNRED